MASSYARAGEAIVLMGRVQNSETSALIAPSAVSTIKYTCYKVTDKWGAKTRTAVTGHSALTIATTAMKDALVTTDARWTKDTTGYNFIYEPDATTNPIFPSEGTYEIVVTITPTTGNAAPLVFEIEVS